jgi:tricorn protease
MRRVLKSWVLVLAGLLAAGHLDAQTKLLRFPDIQGDRVVFTYAGDLWTAPAAGGTAARITAAPGEELFGRFSPDGRSIAFTGQYDGDEQVYVMPAGGGVPKQLTFYPARGPLPPRWGYDNQVYGWTVDGKGVLFRSLRDSWDLGDSKLYTVAVAGGMPEALPMPQSGAGAFSPDGTQVVYSPLFRDFRAWKRYKGGWAQDLWIFDLSGERAKQITNYPGADRDPMWIGDRIYFTSDRDGHLNIYAYDPASQQTTQLTHHTTWDVRWPSDDGRSRIVYELGGELHVLDVTSGQDRKIDIRVPDDLVAKRPSHIEVQRYVEDYALAPKGQRALFVARGDVFSAPIENGRTIDLTHTSGAHDKWARWSPDGRKIAFISDMSGEEELYVIDQDGSGEPQQITKDDHMMLYWPEWSPDSRRIAFGDKEGRLWVVELASQRRVQVADEARGQIFDYNWSPRSGHLAFSMSDPSGFNSLYIWDVDGAKLHRVTGPMFNEFSPAWDRDGDYLYYLSDREYAPQIGSFEWNYVVDRETYIYALALRTDVANPFPPKSDQVAVEQQAEAGEAGTGKAGASAAQASDSEPVAIDFDGLAERVVRVPTEADNYGGLSVTKDGDLLYVKGGPFFYGRGSGQRPSIMVFSMKDREAKPLVEGAGSYALSPDGSKVLVRQGGYTLYDARAGGGEKKSVSTAGLAMDRVPAEEWTEVFDEVWRRYRDWFYVPNMNGYDWNALRAQYRPLLQYAGNRSDVNYIIGEMIAELNNSHTYIAGGDMEIPERAPVALPGARFALDRDAGRYRISEIFQGDNAEPKYRAPLTEVGVNTHEGDYVLAINGRPLTAQDNPYALLRYQAGEPVTLLVNDRPRTEGARKVEYTPIRSETSLIYYKWVEGNRKKVDEATNGRVAYMHIPDMGANGIYEFIKAFYGQIRRDGMIVDVRGNGGGNVSAMLIQRLSRQLLALSYPRTSDIPGTYPRTVFTGPMVALLNETSASDGDIFPAMFKAAGLGPLIGKRSWGGVVGYSGHGPLIDGGSVSVPEFGFANPQGQWIIEGRGVEPDITVENDPISVLQGKDNQLDRAIQEVETRMKQKPAALPPRPKPPVKTPTPPTG